MNGKMNGNGDHGAFEDDEVRADILNPFVHKIEMDNPLDKIKTAVFTVVLLPFRVIVITGVLVAAWFLACIGLHGLSEETLLTQPMTGWRRLIRPILCLLGKWSYLAGGMVITVKGEQAPRSEAPILVVAPHSSFLDSCIVYATKMSSIIVRRESMDNYIGKLINYTQPVYVWRDDPNSRQNTIKRIVERATSKDQNWPQILIFPEGTCTNRSCLITFKPGGFYPGVPVQPVTIRYPNTMDTVTWTWEGPGALKLLWLTLTQVHSACEIEFLPVYYPSEDEKRDPKLFARNVRDVMAKSLGLPVSDYTYDDCLLIKRAKNLNIPGSSSIVEAQKLREMLGLEASNLERHLVGRSFGPIDNNRLDEIEWIDFPSFALRLGINQQDPTAQKLYALYANKRNGLVNWRNYLLSAVFLSQHDSPTVQLLNYAFKIYDTSGRGHLSRSAFTYAVCHSIGVPSHEDAHAHFQQADLDEKNYLTFDEFLSYSRKKLEFSYIFKMEPMTKSKSQ